MPETRFARRVLLRTCAAIIATTLVLPAQFPQAETPANCSGPGATSTNIAYGQSTSGCQISAVVETDVFTFSGAAGDQVRIAIWTPNSLDPRVRVLDPTGTPTFLVDQVCGGSCSMEINLTLVNTTQHTIFVSDSGSNETGAYTMQLERIPPLVAPPVFPHSVAVNDSISPRTDHDFLTFQGTAGDVYEINVYTPNSLDPRIEIWDPTGTSIVDMVCGGSCSMTIPLALTATGPYLVSVSDSGNNETGAYQMTLQCLFSMAGCPPVGGGLTLTASQPFGSGSAEVASTLGPPNVPYILAISADPLNASQPGLGWWGGLHIDVLQLAGQISGGNPPYIGVTDANGASVFSVPGGTLPLGLPTFYAVLRTVDVNYASITATSNIASLTIL